MKKICFITTVSVTIKSFILELAYYLKENTDYQITLICDEDPEFRKSLPEYFNYISVPMKRGISLSGLKAIFNLYKIFKKEKFDLIQYSTPNAAFYSSIAGKLAGIKNRLYCQWGIRYVGFSGVKRKTFKFIEKLVCNLSTWIEPDSYGNLNFSHQEGLYSKDKSSVIWNGSASGVNLEKFDFSKKELWRKEIKDKYKISKDYFVFGFVGRLDKDKGIDELFGAFKKLLEKNKKTILLMIGGKDKVNTIDNNLYEWSLNNKNVIYCGVTNEVEKYMATMDTFLLPSYREGFGSVVVEAEAMGVPVIVTDIPGPTDAMIPNKTGLVVKKADVETLIIAMEDLIENKEKIKQMSNESVKFAQEMFESKELYRYILQDRKRLIKKLSLRTHK